MSRRFFRGAQAQQSPGQNIDMQLRMSKAAGTGKPVIVDPNDGSGPIELQPGDSYTCPGGGGGACTPSAAGPYWIIATNAEWRWDLEFQGWFWTVLQDPDGAQATTGWYIQVRNSSDAFMGHVAVARVVGELCGAVVEWSHEYTCNANSANDSSHTYGPHERFEIFPEKLQGISSGGTFTVITPATDVPAYESTSAAGRITLTASLDGTVLGQVTVSISAPAVG